MIDIPSNLTDGDSVYFGDKRFVYKDDKLIPYVVTNVLYTGSLNELNLNQETHAGYRRNGKDVYQIEVDCGALPNATYKTVDIPNYNASYTYWLSSDSYAFRGSDNTRLPLPYVASNTGVDYNVGASTVGNIILLLTSSNLSSVNISKVVLHYTK